MATILWLKVAKRWHILFATCLIAIQGQAVVYSSPFFNLFSYHQIAKTDIKPLNSTKFWNLTLHAFGLTYTGNKSCPNVIN